jgi:hypothetical protein
MSPVGSTSRVKIKEGSNGFLRCIEFQPHVKGQLTIFIRQQPKNRGCLPRPITFKGKENTNEFSTGTIPHESMEGEITIRGLDESRVGVLPDEKVKYYQPSPKRGLRG